jgi:hypothetical protein
MDKESFVQVVKKVDLIESDPTNILQTILHFSQQALISIPPTPI